jgi:Protein of unknown function (DUF2934)
MATGQRQQAPRTAAPPVSKVEDNTLDEQHAGIGEREFPVSDNDQSTEGGQAHVAASSEEDRRRRIATAAYLRSERRGFLPGAELEDWLEAEKDEDSKRTSTK